MQVTLRKFVKDFTAIINQEVNQRSAKIGKGTIPSLEEYKRQCGQNEGLQVAAQIADAMLRQLEELDDEDDGQLGDLHPKKAGAK